MSTSIVTCRTDVKDYYVVFSDSSNSCFPIYSISVCSRHCVQKFQTFCTIFNGVYFTIFFGACVIAKFAKKQSCFLRTSCTTVADNVDWFVFCCFLRNFLRNFFHESFFKRFRFSSVKFVVIIKQRLRNRSLQSTCLCLCF